ncbi:MAG: two-component system, sensor histidine kinase and response regulator [Gemmatimonadales bacterium]|jgi:two-component system sensor histidine kinase/response regulator|nr:two-component system, sensor histidine kinase and response regulator [Gemmatimonadales bacterium]
MSVNGAGKVLIVDDEPQNVLLLQDLLEARGYRVLTAADGENGLVLASEHNPDVVLLDVMMPRLSGFDVCRRLKAEPGSAMIPVLLVTALDAREDRLAGIDAGASDFISKPIDSADLLLRVRNAVATKRLHDQLATQLRRLKELETARDTLTHMVVHDLRSPLTGLIGYIELLGTLARETGNAEAIEYTADAQAIAGRLAEMVSQVLDVSRLEAGRMPLSVAETDLVLLLPAAVGGLGVTPAGLRVIYELPTEPVPVSCDAAVIGRVVANLVGNAYKFTRRNGEVRIGLVQRNGRVRFSVTDQGPGVAPEYRERIFEKFGQVPSSGSAGARSSGLGLTFCKLAVEAHRGEVGVESAETGGARFWVELPRLHTNEH